jgi:single-stranded DNA-binding protein
MSYLNSITIVGFVGADPEQRQARNNDRSGRGIVYSQCSGRIAASFGTRAAHASLSLTTREIAFDNLPQLSVSFSSCRRPNRVSQ